MTAMLRAWLEQQRDEASERDQNAEWLDYQAFARGEVKAYEAVLAWLDEQGRPADD